MEHNQLDTVNFTSVDQRTAQVAVVNQGLDPTLAGQLMTAQQQALQTEANALHSEVLERQRELLVSEAGDHLTCIEQTAAEEISQKNLQLNEQAAQAMNDHKSAQIHVQSQDQRIKELNAELHQAQSTAGLMNTSFQKTSSDLSAARSQFSQRITYKNQIDALNQQIMDMQKSADLHRKDFEREIEKLRQEQKDLIRHLKPQPLEGTPGLHSNYQPGIGPPRLLTISPSGSGW